MASINTELYPIGTADIFIKKVIGLFNYSSGMRNFSLDNNPLEMRYAGEPSTYTSISSEYIGQAYNMYDRRKNFEHFWDNEGGIVGFTYNEGYLNTINSTVIENFNELRSNITDFGNDVKDLVYNNPVNFHRIDNLNGNSDAYDNIINYMYNEGYENTKNISVINNINDLKRSITDFGNKVNDLYNTEIYKSPVNFHKIDFSNGNSVDKPSITDYDTNLVKSTKTREQVQSTSYEVYNEDNIFVEGNSNKPVGTIISTVSSKPNSLVSKTNELFKQGKISSLINRFYKNQDETNELESAVDDVYGISRGRNLVKKGDTVKYNGYEDPYCRVWTISNQYSKYGDVIRPFYENGVNLTADGFDKKDFMEGLRPFGKGGNIRVRSSMQDNGLPLIAPMNHNGGLNKDDIKRCMFSIENLAWRDINFDAEVKDRKTKVKRGFGKVLSDEQQGPNGGRIMWFPPYNLKFTENVNVNWNSNSFIGRGEQIYTYVNTDRGGTLDFTLLIDHPSILDLYSRSVGGNATNDNDQEILRFFAGCGMIKPLESIVTNSESENEQDELRHSNEAVPSATNITINKTLFAFFPNDFSGIDYLDFPEVVVEYLKNGGKDSTGYEVNESNGIMGCIGVEEKVVKSKDGFLNVWHYEVDDKVSNEVLGSSDNYKDLQSFGLNNNNLLEILKESGTPSGISATLTKTDKQTAKSILCFNDMSDEEIEETIVPFVNINSLKDVFVVNTPVGTIDLLQRGKVKIRCVGFASSHGYNNSNLILARNRARLLQEYLIKTLKFNREWFEEPTIVDANVPVNDKGISSFVAKLGRHAAVYIETSLKDDVPTLNRSNSSNTTVVEEKISNKTELKGNTVTNSKIREEVKIVDKKSEYDSEYLYFKEIQKTDDLVKKYITNKVQYFDPAFHSITPEGFNARLTFLHQCTRQGPTVAASDTSNAGSAGNLAFGRPPVCVLRIGDFYNTRIIIDSISINYDNNGVQWDMNTEGIGLQPMFANVSISFKFIGGSDLSGPISRLQNAVSYNFFANTSVYDRHADYRNAFIDNKGGDKVNEWQAGINIKNFNEENSNND